MSNLIFKEYEQGVYIALLDITEKAEELFSNIEKAYIEISRFYEEFEGDIDAWKFNIEYELDYNDYIYEDFVEIPCEHLYIKFKTGKVISFYTSEYGQVSNQVDNIFD